MNYGYIRVSSISQNVDRQMEELLKFGVEKKNIFIDKQSGKDFERENYKKLLKKLKEKDVIIIKSIDRLGRNYRMIIEEWHSITKIKNCDIVVLDMPLLDTRVTPSNLVATFISDIVLQILSFVAENERTNIKQRQAEGIKIAKEKGKHLGRPKYVLPDNFIKVANEYSNHNISYKDACNLTNMKKCTFYKYYNLLKEV
jgi:DNA invertase Pin-like site-specific DNA recombinase